MVPMALGPMRALWFVSEESAFSSDPHGPCLRRSRTGGQAVAHALSRRQLLAGGSAAIMPSTTFGYAWDGGRGNFRIRTEDVLRVLALDLDENDPPAPAEGTVTSGALISRSGWDGWFTEAALLDYLGQHAARRDGPGLALPALAGQGSPPLRRQAEKGAPGNDFPRRPAGVGLLVMVSMTVDPRHRMGAWADGQLALWGRIDGIPVGD